MSISNRFIFRKMKNSFGQMLGMGLLILVATLFFVTIFSFRKSFQYFAEAYFKENHYAEIMLTGSFTEQDVNKLAELKKVKTVEPRALQEFKNKDVTYRVITLTSQMNQLTLLKGRLPKSTEECVVLNQFAEEQQSKLGDRLQVGDHNLKIVGIVNSPEYVYYVQNARTMFADPKTFAVLFVTTDFIPTYNQLLLETNENLPEKELKKQVNFAQYTKQTDQINYQMYDGDLDQFEAFAFIFPIVFWVISFSIIFILLKRTILKEHKQIGIMKALGHKNRTIAKVYLTQFGLLGLLAAGFGCLGAIPVLNWLLSMLHVMIELPNLTLQIYPAVWAFAILVSILGCLLAGSLAIFSTLRELPSSSMKPRMPKMSKQSLVERLPFLWQRLSFNTRYAFKSAIRNKGRFFVMVLGVGASAALLVFSFGFNDSIGKVTQQYFSNFASYDVAVETAALPLENSLLDQYKQIQKQDKALQLSAKVADEEYLLTIVEADVSLLDLNKRDLLNGIVIPEYYAEKWEVGKGDQLKIDDTKVKVAGIIPMGMGLSIFTSYDYAEKVFDQLPKVSNLTYLETDNVKSLKKALLADEIVFSTAEDDISSFDTLLENLQILIWVLIACGVILGMTVILCINLMNLTIREFEYMFMNIMGYSKQKILLAIFKESFVQLCLAIPLGFVGGELLLHAIKGEFSQNTFALYPSINFSSFVISALLVIVMSSTRLVAANRFVDQLEIVEGLKVQDD